jgi:hypothetical protein
MRNLLSLIFFAATAVSANAASISLSNPAVALGPFDVTVQVTDVFAPPHDADALLGYGFNISFDPAIFSYLGDTAGPLFDSLSGNPGIGAQVAGTVQSSLVFLLPGDFVEPLTLVTLHFGVVGYGSSNISISADALNLDQGLIYLGGSDSFTASTSVESVPEPGVFLTAGLGLLALAGARRSGWRLRP